MSFFQALDDVVDFVHTRTCGPSAPPQTHPTLPAQLQQVSTVAQPVIANAGQTVAPTPPPATPSTVVAQTTTPPATTLRRRNRTPTTPTPTPPSTAPATPRTWTSMAGSLVKGAVLLPFQALYKTAALTATVASAVYRRATFANVAGPALGYLASNYAPATVQLTAAGVGSVTGYTPPASVVASVAGSLVAYTASKAAPTAYHAALKYGAEKLRKLPPALAKTGLNKSDISPELASTIAKIPAANQTIFGQALVTLRSARILTPASSAVLLASKFPLSVAKAMVLLPPNDLSDCTEILKGSDDAESLAKIFAILLAAGVNVKPLAELPSSPFASASVQRLDRLLKTLNALDGVGKLKVVFDLIGLNLLQSEEPLLIAESIVALHTAGLTANHATFSPLFIALEKAPADSLKNIVPVLQAVQDQRISPDAASALIASQNPQALANIFFTLRAANLYISPLLQKTTVCDPKKATAPQLEMLARALNWLRVNSAPEEFDLFVKEVLASNTPAALADSIVLLKHNGLLTREKLATLVQYTDEVSQIITLLANEGMLTDRNYTAIMKEKDPLAAAKKQTAAEGKLREQRTLAQGILTAGGIAMAAVTNAVNGSQDPQRLAHALVKLQTLRTLSNRSLAEMVRLDGIHPGANALIQLADEMVGRF